MHAGVAALFVVWVITNQWQCEFYYSCVCVHNNFGQNIGGAGGGLQPLPFFPPQVLILYQQLQYIIEMDMLNDSMTLMNDSMTMMNTSASSFRCGLPPFFPPALNIPQAINYIQATIAITVGLVGCLLNVLLLFTIIKYKSLHQRLMYLALQIVLVDLLYTVTIPPVIFTSGITGEYQFGDFMCNILGFIHDFFAIFRFTMTLMLALDRFISVFCPFFYKRNSFHFICVLLVIVYIVSFVRVILPLSGIMGCFLYVHTQKTCTAFSGCSGGCFILIVCSSFVHYFIWNGVSLDIVHHSLLQD